MLSSGGGHLLSIGSGTAAGRGLLLRRLGMGRLSKRGQCFPTLRPSTLDSGEAVLSTFPRFTTFNCMRGLVCQFRKLKKYSRSLYLTREQTFLRWSSLLQCY